MKTKHLIWLTLVIILFLLGFTFWHTPSDRPGVRYPIVAFGIFLTLFATKTSQGKKKTNIEQEPITDESLAAQTIKFCFVPGGELFSDDMKNALERPNAADVSKCALILLLAIVFGSSFLSFTTILTGTWPVFNDWYTTANQMLWLSVYSMSALLFVIFSGMINALVWVSIRQGYHINITEQLESITNYFAVPHSKEEDENRAEFWCQLSGKLDHIYGHKTWGGRKMYNLLNKIQDRKEEMGTSQWFLLQFAADALDHHVLDNKVGITFTYDNDREYSKFLEESMGYCTKSMIWVVDRKDFHQKLFPVIVREVLLSLASHLTSQNDPILKSLNQLKDRASEEGGKISPHSIDFCKKCCEIYIDENASCGHISGGEKGCKYKTWDDVLEGYTKCWGNDVIQQKFGEICSTSFDEIKTLYGERKSDRFPYPHLQKFYEHPVPKSRIIEISEFGGWLGCDAYQRCRLVLKDFLVSLKIKYTEGNDIKNIDALTEYYIIDKLGMDSLQIDSTADTDEIKEKKKNARRYIFYLAWNLFKLLSNSNTKQKVVGFACVDKMISKERSVKDSLLAHEETHKPHFDLGIYDQRVMVNSVPNRGRVVQWSILPDTARIFTDIDPLKEGPRKKVLQLTDFVDFIEEKIL
jgi:hypothetical protein